MCEHRVAITGYPKELLGRAAVLTGRNLRDCKKTVAIDKNLKNVAINHEAP